jgi:hypothetical protein
MPTPTLAGLIERLGDTPEEQAYWAAKHKQRFLASRWCREGKTFEWWLKRRGKLRRISRQQQKAAARQ